MEQINRYPLNKSRRSTSQGDWYTTFGDVKGAYLQGCVHLDPVLVVYVNRLGVKERGRVSKCLSSGYIPAAGGTVAGTARILADAFSLPTLQTSRRMGSLSLNFSNFPDAQKIEDLECMVSLMHEDSNVRLNKVSQLEYKLYISSHSSTSSITPLKKPSLKALGIPDESDEEKSRRATAMSWITENTVLTYSPRTYAIKRYTAEEFSNAT